MGREGKLGGGRRNGGLGVSDGGASTSSLLVPPTRTRRRRHATKSPPGGPRRSARNVRRRSVLSLPGSAWGVALQLVVAVALFLLSPLPPVPAPGRGRVADRSVGTRQASECSSLGLQWHRFPSSQVGAAAAYYVGAGPPTALSRTRGSRRLRPPQLPWSPAPSDLMLRPPPPSQWDLPRVAKARWVGLQQASSSSSSSDGTTESADNNKPSAGKPPQRRVNYVRPSAAIERGSGFFVPGLEGEKARLALSAVLMALCVVQGRQLLASDDDGILASTSAVTSLVLAASYSGLAVLQSGIEWARGARRRETSKTTVDSGGSSTRMEVSFSCSWAEDGVVREAAADTGGAQVEDYMDRVEWTASTYLSLTSSERILLVHKDRVIVDTQRSPSATATSVTAAEDEAGAACRSALTTLQQSSTGRVALPSNHPTFQFVSSLETNPVDESATGGSRRVRTVILQRIDPQSCWVVASSDLLAAYTPQDLTWLGQLAGYVSRNG